MATKSAAKPEKKKRRVPPLPAAVVGLLCKAQVCDAIGGCSTRWIDKMVLAGEFPKADCSLGRHPRWSVEIVNQWCLSRRKPIGS